MLKIWRQKGRVRTEEQLLANRRWGGMISYLEWRVWGGDMAIRLIYRPLIQKVITFYGHFDIMKREIRYLLLPCNCCGSLLSKPATFPLVLSPLFLLSHPPYTWYYISIILISINAFLHDKKNLQTTGPDKAIASALAVFQRKRGLVSF